MTTNRGDAPPPDLRIVRTESLQPHEENDFQRTEPLIERFQHDEFFISPPIVAPLDATRFVVLDGANRSYAFARLGHPHVLVQVTPYESGYVELGTWRHVVSGWDAETFVERLHGVDAVEVVEGQSRQAVAHVLLRDGRTLALRSSVENTHERNAALREIVKLYQRAANLYRTAMTEPDDLWPLFPDAIGVVVFPAYTPADIMAAAKYRAYLPPGISRHIVHGRALHVNYPMAWLCDRGASLSEKNEQLQGWLRRKLAERQVRYYAEATYQFGE